MEPQTLINKFNKYISREIEVNRKRKCIITKPLHEFRTLRENKFSTIRKLDHFNHIKNDMIIPNCIES